MKFTIDRSKWLRGETDSMLYRPRDGKMCCIGQVCLQLGFHEADIKEIGDVASLLCDSISQESAAQQLGNLAQENPRVDGLWEETAFAYEAYAINDSQERTEGEREADLIKHFAANGHELEFI